MKPAGGQRHAADSGYRYRDQRKSRCAALALTIAIHAGLLALLVVRFQGSFAAAPEPAPLVVTLLPLASAPDPAREIPPGPEQVERKKAAPEKRLNISPVVVPHALATAPQPETPIEPGDPGPPAPTTTAPEAVTAPPARLASSDTERTWEALLLAHLQKYRRYPSTARARGQEGIAFVRFRMNRAGRVLSATLSRSAGFPDLDREAIATLHRAAPLPSIPRGKPDEIDLSVPIEFFLR